ncbi:MAG: hypothetical protein A2Y07_10045 [Planctomycetes bacterium GWF2_50_10]|nr:MAG: hypothetical protein A2Y07_10045 [Planctomycetes bacterium GWF2_50_10]
MRQFTLLMIICCLGFCGCNRSAKTGSPRIREAYFPPQMIGVWEVQVGPLSTQKWELKFDKDGTIPEMFHYVAGRVIVKEGGIMGEGPDPNTYFAFDLGPVETGYDPNSEIIKVRIVIKDYELKFPKDSLKGRMEDTLVGKASKDGKTWEVEWRSYGWLEGATDPDIENINRNPEKIVFNKRTVL